ncbi:MAG: exodeoxyribonuclease VII large subunit [Fibrobacter sp.]|nr:exodeoxyribonuclease VII large subunit [Fibrobacter sp.]
MEQPARTFSVMQYMTSIKNRLADTPAVWVHGVITRLSDKGKVVYISIADFEEGNVKPIATVDLTCFAGQFAALRAKTETAATPFVIKEELKVCFLIKADVYIPSGKLQAKILDIDPVYTLGELAVTKAAILKKLAMEGLLEKNKSLPLPQMPLCIGLITGENTAAYKDFTTRLEASPFRFRVVTAFARMQGNDTEPSILGALEKLRDNDEIDIVCIIRGGGAKTDLNYFDSEILCRAVANYPIPVFTGIGHEIDRSLLDEVAGVYCITPTDCAKRIVEIALESWNKLTSTAKEIANATRLTLANCSQQLNAAAHRLSQKVSTRIQEEKTRHAVIYSTLRKDSRFLIREERARVDRNTDGLHQGSRKILDLAKSKFEIIELRVKNANPETALAKGYTLSLDKDGKFIRNASQLKSGDTLRTKFKDGTVESIVR